jgi:hypothetical protein
MTTHVSKPKHEIDRVLLARVEKEMDEPRMTESAREEEGQVPPEHGPEQGGSPQSIERSIETEGGKKHGKADHRNP